ncbi:MAG: peptidoglycan editing factor PgeF [Rhizobiales bacterium]|nr:peptidoglycan editing factor PgeF [Hyphomicrobiales bacterium]
MTKENISVQSLRLEEQSIRHGFFTRNGGVSTGLYASLNGGIGSDDNAEHVLENRQRMATHLGVQPDQMLIPYQVHSPHVSVVDSPWGESDRPKSDALVTATPNLAIGITTADCTPILFADPKARIIGAAHAGWRGALDGILEATIAAMVNLGAQEGDIQAVIGPTISQACYEVGPEFKDRFMQKNDAFAKFFRPGPNDRPHFDLPKFVAHQLAASGIDKVENLDRCTYQEKDVFFSYRRSTHLNEPDYGRQLSLIVL